MKLDQVGLQRKLTFCVMISFCGESWTILRKTGVVKWKNGGFSIGNFLALALHSVAEERNLGSCYSGGES